MSDTLDEQHASVALDLLDANAALSGRVHDGEVPAGATRPYVLVYTDIRWPPGEEGAANAFDHASVTCRTTWYLHCVAESAAAVRQLTGQVRVSLLDASPLVVPTGRACARLTEDDAQPPAKDETTGTTVFDGVLVFSMISVPG